MFGTDASSSLAFAIQAARWVSTRLSSGGFLETTGKVTGG